MEQTMLAAVFDRPGPMGEVIHLRDMPVPVPAPGELLVRVHAASVHPADAMFTEGRYRMKPQFPQIAGLVGSGTLVDGCAAEGWPAGTRVAFRRAGAWAEYCCVPRDRVYPVPAGVSEHDACQIALNPLTACGLLDMAGVREGDWVALNAAGSNVAQLVRSLARQKGIQVIGIHRQLPNGSGEFDVAEGDGLDARLRSAAGRPISALLDCVGGPAITDVLPALRQGAAIVSYGTLGPQPAMVSNADIVYRNLRWCGFGIDHWLDGLGSRASDVIRDAWNAARGGLPLPVGAAYPLGEIERALSPMSGQPAGKTIITMRQRASR
jgi:NADPH:quinone reductase-like Zn-dependent oxidoreductase